MAADVPFNIIYVAKIKKYVKYIAKLTIDFTVSKLYVEFAANRP